MHEKTLDLSCYLVAIKENTQDLKEMIMAKQYDRLYLGYGYCERLIDFISYEDMIAYVHSLQLPITFSLPPVHQRYLHKYENLVIQIMDEDIIDEVVVNDESMLMLCDLKELYKKKKIILGRLFNHAIRETRFDITTIPEMTDSIFTLNQSFYKEHFHISGFEGDTLVDGILTLDDENYSIYYPRIYLSRMTYCEYFAINKKPSQKYNLNLGCSFPCQSIYQKYENTRLPIIKYENTIYTLQRKPIEDCVKGNYRIIYFGGCQ